MYPKYIFLWEMEAIFTNQIAYANNCIKIVL